LARGPLCRRDQSQQLSGERIVWSARQDTAGPAQPPRKIRHGRSVPLWRHLLVITISFASSFPTSRNQVATSFTLSGANTPLAPIIFRVITSSSPDCAYEDS